MSNLNRNLSDREVSRPQDVVPQIVNQQMVQPQTADREMRYYLHEFEGSSSRDRSYRIDKKGYKAIT